MKHKVKGNNEGIIVTQHVTLLQVHLCHMSHEDIVNASMSHQGEQQR